MRKTPKRFLIAGVLLLAAAIGFQAQAPGLLPDLALGFLYGTGIACLFGAALLSRLPEPCDTGTPALRRRYLREFMPAMAAYVVTLFASVWLLRHVDEPGLRALVALLPVPAIAMAMRAIVRYIRDADELQRRIELEAVSIATAFVSLGYLAAGFLQSAKVVDIPASAAMIWVFPLVCLVYGVAKAAVSRRYG